MEEAPKRKNGYNLGPKSHVNIAMPNHVYERFLKYAQEHELTEVAPIFRTGV